jgi:hypothetical protein
LRLLSWCNILSDEMIDLSFTIAIGPCPRSHSQVQVPIFITPKNWGSDRIRHPFGDQDQILITVRQLRVSWCGALSLTRWRVCRLQLLLALASAVILGFESCGTRDHILLSHILEFPFHCLLRLAGPRWSYSTPPPHGKLWSGLNTLRTAWQICDYPFKNMGTGRQISDF